MDLSSQVADSSTPFTMEALISQLLLVLSDDSPQWVPLQGLYSAAGSCFIQGHTHTNQLVNEQVQNPGLLASIQHISKESSQLESATWVWLRALIQLHCNSTSPSTQSSLTLPIKSVIPQTTPNKPLHTNLNCRISFPLNLNYNNWLLCWFGEQFNLLKTLLYIF